MDIPNAFTLDADEFLDSEEQAELSQWISEVTHDFVTSEPDASELPADRLAGIISFSAFIAGMQYQRENNPSSEVVEFPTITVPMDSTVLVEFVQFMANKLKELQE